MPGVGARGVEVPRLGEHDGDRQPAQVVQPDVRQAHLKAQDDAMNAMNAMNAMLDKILRLEAAIAKG